MNRYTQTDLEIPGPAAALLPPVVEETGWDILLALHSDRRAELSIGKLGAQVSAHRMVLGHWLSWLEERWLIAAARDKVSGELRAVLTPEGRDLLDGYLSAINAFQSSAGY